VRALVVDVGNTRLRAVLWTGAESERPAAQAVTGALDLKPLDELIRIATPQDRDGLLATAENLTTAAAAANAAATIVVAVVPTVTATLGAALTKSVVIDHQAPFPFTLGVTDPAAVGADRYANIAAAAAAGLSDALVVDCGTATTFDVLQDGTFAGGLIAPGMAFAAAQLGAVAARLKPVPFAPCSLRAGGDTESAMRAGAYHVGRYGILGTIAALRRRYGEPPVILTGGLGGMLGQKEWLYDPDWTMRGAAWLGERIISSG
jgi:pantothenate kinase type III